MYRLVLVPILFGFILVFFYVEIVVYVDIRNYCGSTAVDLTFFYLLIYIFFFAVESEVSKVTSGTRFNEPFQLILIRYKTLCT